MQPPPRAGERQLGVFVDSQGRVTRRSAVSWRSPPLVCGYHGQLLLTLLPKSLEVHHLHRESPPQTLPFPGARGAASGGDFFLAASADAVYALLPPLEVARGSGGGSASSHAENDGSMTENSSSGALHAGV